MNRDITGWIVRGLAALMFCAAAVAHAQDFPSRPIKIVVTYPPGGGTDLTARLVGKRLSERLGQPVIIENKAGAGGGIGTAAVAKAAPDGYTLVMGNSGPIAINPAMYTNIGYDSAKDFAPVALLTVMPIAICVRNESPLKTVADVIALGRSGKAVNFASSGSGSLTHLAGELFNMQAKTKFVHVPYKGSATVKTAILGGDVDVGLLSSPDIIPLAEAGKLRALVSYSPTRSPLMPDVPTMAESGVAGVALDIWYGLLAPAGTPRPIVERLNREVNAILGEPAIRESLMKTAQSPTPVSPDEFMDIIRSDLAKYADLVKTTGARAN